MTRLDKMMKENEEILIKEGSDISEERRVEECSGRRLHEKKEKKEDGRQFIFLVEI